MKKIATARALVLITLAFGAPGVVQPAAAQNNPQTPPPVAPALPPPQNPPVAVSAPLTALVWDAELKEYSAKPGEGVANFTFWFTNTSPNEVVITSASSSCFCTVAQLPETPWRQLPGTNNHINVTMNLAGKVGPSVEKPVIVVSSAGTKQLLVRTYLPTNPPAGGFAVSPQRSETERLAGMSKALADRQVVFKDANCTSCHADRARNQTDGMVIYNGVCAVCHDSAHRAPAVADLHSLKHETDLDYWKYWISNGRAGSMMPAFAQSEGGPLTEPQINALAAYCLKTFQPAATPGSPIPGATTNAAVSSVGVAVPRPPTAN